MLVTLAYIVALGSAGAAEPLVVVGDRDAAIRQAVAGVGRSAEAFEVVTWAELIAAPVIIGDGAWTPCAGASRSVAQFVLAVSGADSALSRGDLERAASELAAANAAAACLDADPPSAELGRWHRVRGALGDDASLARARALDPAVAWSAAWPTERKVAYEHVNFAEPVAVQMHAWDVPLRVDAGGEVPRELAPGAYTVRSPNGEVRGLLTVAEEPLDVVLTSTYPADPSGDLDAVRGKLTPLLVGRFGAGNRVYVASARAAWAATAGRTDWLMLREVQRSPWILRGGAVVGVGAVAGGIGVAGAALVQGNGNAAVREMNAATTESAWQSAREAYDAALGAHTAWNAVLWSGIGLAAVGTGVLTFGLVQGEVEVTASLSPEGGAVAMVGRW